MSVTRIRIASKTVFIALVVALAGCCTDQKRTGTEGTVTRDGAGPAIGGLPGAAVSCHPGGADKLVVCDVAGTPPRSVAGYNWGKNVTRKRERYAKIEDYLDACIGDAHACTLAAERENAILRGQVAQWTEGTRHLALDCRQGRADRQAWVTMANTINQRWVTVRQAILHTERQMNIARQEMLAARAGDGAAARRIAELNAEIQALSTQKAELESQNQQLAAISSRLGT